MKQYFSLLIIISIANSIAAQTITRDWIPQVSSEVVFLSAAVDMANPIEPGDAGTGIIWDFSAVSPDDTLPPILTEFVDPAQTSFASEFPDANIASTPSADSLEGILFNYFLLTDNDFSNLGAAIEITEGNSFIRYSDPQIIMQFPFSFGDSFSDTWERTSTTTADGFTVELVNSGVDEVSYDGTGTLITPAGTFEDVLRIKSTTVQSDTNELAGSLSITNFEIESYVWLKDNFAGLANYSRIVSSSELIIPGFPPTVQGPTETIDFSWAAGDISTNNRNIKKFEELSTRLRSSNPVQDSYVQIEVETQHGGTVEVGMYDFAGKLHQQGEMQVTPGIQQINLNLSTVPYGLYNVVLTMNGANRRGIVPLVVAR